MIKSPTHIDSCKLFVYTGSRTLELTKIEAFHIYEQLRKHFNPPSKPADIPKGGDWGEE